MGVCPQAFNRQWATGASHRAQAQRSTPTNRIVCSHVGASNHARGCLSLAMHRHYIGSKCHVLIMGVRIDNPCMGLSHNVASARWGHQTMPEVPQRSHASALYRHEMPRAYHGRWLWQPVHGAQPPHSRIVRYFRRPQGRGFIAPHLDFPQLAHALLHGVALELQNMGLSHLSHFPASFPTISRKQENFWPVAGVGPAAAGGGRRTSTMALTRGKQQSSLCLGGGIKPCPRYRSAAMHRHYIGKKCRVLIMGVGFGSPCMGLSPHIRALCATSEGHKAEASSHHT